MEEDFSSSCSPLQGDAGKELLRHLLKDKLSPATTPSPRAQTPPTARFQLSNENVHSEEEDRLGSQGTMVSRASLLSCGHDAGSDVGPYDGPDDLIIIMVLMLILIVVIVMVVIVLMFVLTHLLLPPPGEQPGPPGPVWQEEGSSL